MCSVILGDSRCLKEPRNIPIMPEMGSFRDNSEIIVPRQTLKMDLGHVRIGSVSVSRDSRKEVRSHGPQISGLTGATAGSASG